MPFNQDNFTMGSWNETCALTRIPIILSCIALLVLAGCANPVQQQVSLKPPRAKIGSCMDAVQSTNWIALQVPSSQSGMANKMAAAAVKMGGSDTTTALISFLSQSTRPALALVGDSDELTAATLLAALDKLSNVPQRSRSPICFIGDARYTEQLKGSAESIGLPLFVVSR